MLAEFGPTGGDGTHLAEWRRIAALDNRRRNDELERLGRLFSLQHYWRVLHTRHPRVSYRNIRGVEALFAQFYGVKAATIHADLQAIRRRLGSRWPAPARP